GRSALAAPGKARPTPRKATAAPAAGKARPKVRPKAGAAKASKVSASVLRRAKSHQLRPAHVTAAQSDAGVSAAQRTIRLAPRRRRPRLHLKTPSLHVGDFGEAIHQALATTTTGYAMQLRHNGTPVYNLLWEWARTPYNGGAGWSMGTRMHVASVSKLLTAMAMVHALNASGLSVDDRIAPHLPSYWSTGARIGDLTFRHLLTHTSGFRGGGSASDYGFMRGRVAAGVASTFGMYGYHNMNFGLCRILIPVVRGSISRTASFGDLTNTVWDLQTTALFRDYCNAQIFAPAGVHNVGFAPSGVRALAYRQPHSGIPGWDSGDLATAAGGAGFRMSIDELLAVMGTFRRGGAIVSPSEAQDALDARLGIDQRIDTPAGSLYNKNGAWRDSSTNPRQEQCVAYFFPNNMELACYVNSPIAGNGSLRGIVADAFVASLRP
ncbi:MAG: serine hydrolase domain-containing protein, partial [Myxococcota bacterium]